MQAKEGACFVGYYNDKSGPKTYFKVGTGIAVAVQYSGPDNFDLRSYSASTFQEMLDRSLHPDKMQFTNCHHSEFSEVFRAVLSALQESVWNTMGISP